MSLLHTLGTSCIFLPLRERKWFRAKGTAQRLRETPAWQCVTWDFTPTVACAGRLPQAISTKLGMMTLWFVHWTHSKESIALMWLRIGSDLSIDHWGAVVDPADVTVDLCSLKEEDNWLLWLHFLNTFERWRPRCARVYGLHKFVLVAYCLCKHLQLLMHLSS